MAEIDETELNTDEVELGFSTDDAPAGELAEVADVEVEAQQQRTSDISLDDPEVVDELEAGDAVVAADESLSVSDGSDESVDDGAEIFFDADGVVIDGPVDADGSSDAEVDPYDTFRRELRVQLGKWYVVHSYAGYEKRVKENLLRRRDNAIREGEAGGDDIFQVEVPVEEVREIKNGQPKMVKRVRIPGYVLVRMNLNEDTWSLVRHTPAVTGFVGNAHNPSPLRFDEAFEMLKPVVDVQLAEAANADQAKGKSKAKRVIPTLIDYEIGETIQIKDGSFAGLPGTLSEIKPESGKLIVLVSLFERETPVELSYDQVEKL